MQYQVRNIYNKIYTIYSDYSLTINMSFFAIILYFVNKKYFFIALFVVLDILLHIFEANFHINTRIYPFDYGVVLLSFMYGFEYGLILLLTMIITRIIQMKFKPAHLTKISILVMVAILSNVLNFFPILVIGPLMFLSRYILEFIFKLLIIRQFDAKNWLGRIINCFNSIIFYLLLGNFLIYIMA
jgi:hypothetical protein